MKGILVSRGMKLALMALAWTAGCIVLLSLIDEQWVAVLSTAISIAGAGMTIGHIIANKRKMNAAKKEGHTERRVKSELIKNNNN